MARANAIAAKVRSLHGEQLDERDYAELLAGATCLRSRRT